MREKSPDNTNDTSSTPCKAISLYYDQEYVEAWSKDGSLKTINAAPVSLKGKRCLQDWKLVGSNIDPGPKYYPRTWVY